MIRLSAERFDVEFRFHCFEPSFIIFEIKWKKGKIAQYIKYINNKIQPQLWGHLINIAFIIIIIIIDAAIASSQLHQIQQI